MSSKRHQNRLLLSKIIRQKDDFAIHPCSRYRNFNSSKKYRVISANNNCFECVFFNKMYDIFTFKNVYKY